MTDPFHIDHSEKIEFMIETDGFAREAVAPQPELDAPVGGYPNTIGFPATSGSPTSSCSG